MNSPAIRQNIDSWSTLFGAHLRAVMQRSDAALAKTGYQALLIHAGTPPLIFLDDHHLPFKAHAPFKVWAPLSDAPDSFVYYAPGKKPLLLVNQPVDYWHKSPELPDTYWSGEFEIVSCADRAAARAALPRDLSRTAFIGQPFPDLLSWGPGTINPEHLMAQLDYARAAKTPYEIACLSEANRLGALGHVAAEKAFRAGASEFDIHMAYCSAARQGAAELPYGNIVALNRHGAVLHYMDFDRAPPAQLRSFLIDAGASHAGYACDITRTYSADPGDEFQALVNAVDLAQQRMCAQVRAGFDYRQLHLDAHMALATILRDFGVITVSPEAAVATGVSSAFFPHGVGHGIGLQVHEVAGFAESDAGGSIAKPEGHPYLRLTRMLEPGMVVTIEPGIYFIDMLLDALRAGPHAGSVDWARVDAFRPFGGIRIEDDVVCTDAAPVNLTREGFAALA